MIVVGKKMVSLVRSSGAHPDGGAWVIGGCLLLKGKRSGPSLASGGPSWGSGFGSFGYAWVNNLAGSVAKLSVGAGLLCWSGLLSC